MHELSMAQALADQLLEVLERERVTTVKQINLENGPLSGIQTEAFDFAWPLVIAGTPLEGATLRWTHQPVRVHCGACGQDGEPSDTMRCQACQQPQVTVVSGRDFRVRSMEVS